MVREAGGFIGDFKGQENFHVSGELLVASPKIYSLLLKVLQENGF